MSKKESIDRSQVPKRQHFLLSMGRRDEELRTLLEIECRGYKVVQVREAS